MLLVRSNRYETFVRTFFLKLCQKDNHLQSRETLKLLLIKINFTFSGREQLLIFRRSLTFIRSQLRSSHYET